MPSNNEKEVAKILANFRKNVKQIEITINSTDFKKSYKKK